MREHGDYESGRSEQLILFAARGPWNDETLRRGSRLLGEYIAELDRSKPWGQLSCLYGESLMPPSAYAIFVKQTKIRKQAGMQALAIVVRHSEITLTIKAQLTNAYTDADIDHAFFDDIETASHWLAQQRIHFSTQDVTAFFAHHVFL